MTQFSLKLTSCFKKGRRSLASVKESNARHINTNEIDLKKLDFKN